jgi:hypothetical protein
MKMGQYAMRVRYVWEWGVGGFSGLPFRQRVVVCVWGPETIVLRRLAPAIQKMVCLSGKGGSHGGSSIRASDDWIMSARSSP